MYRNLLVWQQHLATTVASAIESADARFILVSSTGAGQGKTRLVRGLTQTLHARGYVFLDLPQLFESEPADFPRGTRVIVDGPPMMEGQGLFVVPQRWLEAFDGAILVVAKRDTRRDELEQALAWLEASGTECVGLVWNDLAMPPARQVFEELASQLGLTTDPAPTMQVEARPETRWITTAVMVAIVGVLVAAALYLVSRKGGGDVPVMGAISIDAGRGTRADGGALPPASRIVPPRDSKKDPEAIRVRAVAKDAGVAPSQKPDAAPKPTADLEPAPPGMIAVPPGEVARGVDALRVKALSALCKQEMGVHPETDRACAASVFEAERLPAKARVKAFHIDKYEVSQEAYDECVKAGVCRKKRLRWEYKRHPATGITISRAEKYCEWRRKRLPTRAEWLLAAGARDGRLFPWGDEAPIGPPPRANHGKMGKAQAVPANEDGYRFVSTVEAYEKLGVSEFGMIGAAGNVREWVSDKAGENAVAVGGGWRDLQVDLRLSRRLELSAATFSDDLGFRCAADPP